METERREDKGGQEDMRLEHREERQDVDMSTEFTSTLGICQQQLHTLCCPADSLSESCRLVTLQESVLKKSNLSCFVFLLLINEVTTTDSDQWIQKDE